MNGWLIIPTKMDTKQFDKQIEYIKQQMEEIDEKLKQADAGFEVGDTAKLEQQYEKLNNQLNNLSKQQEKINNQGLKNFEESVKNIGSSTGDAIKKVGRWALAILGVRSAYMAVRRIASTLGQYNQQISEDLSYIQYAISSAFEPLIQRLISMAYTLLSYVNMIAKAWFNIDLFANASAKNMKKAGGSAKELKKTIAGFDEMNVISDNSSSGGIGGVSPSFDLSSLEAEPPKWLQFIIDNGEEIVSIISGLITGIALIKLGVDALTATGIGLIIAGLMLSIKGIISFIKDPSWKNFLTILEGISLIIAGISLLTGNWIVAIIALGVALISYIVKNWDEIKEILGKVGGWIYDNIIKPIANFFAVLWNGLKTGAKNVWNAIKDVFSSVGSFFSGVWGTIKKTFTNIAVKIGEAVSTAFKNTVNAVLNTISKIINTPINAINKLISVINAVPGINISKLNTINIPKLAKGGIINNPGKGVFTGSAIVGERGREFYMPLQDEEMLSLVGQSIAKYVRIDNTIDVNIDSRKINRILTQSKSRQYIENNGGVL